jgi:glyoxylase-like metal-dependent hydrolase (beta-lactamase superfamily II)
LQPPESLLLSEAFRIGAVKVHRVEEWHGGVAPPHQLFVGYESGPWSELEASVTPQFFRDYFQDGNCYLFLQSWLLELDDQIVLFDTGIGNNKQRPGLPTFSNAQTAFLDNFAATGISPDSVSIVINSHLHVDHVGWNTRLLGGRWVPTFPNARYMFSAAERDFWNPTTWSNRAPRGAAANANSFEDSIQPILDAGLVEIVSPGREVLPGMTLYAAPGHTPGQLILEVESEGELGMLVADVLHHPAQIYRPTWSSVFCEDPILASETRGRILARAADRGAKLIPAHFSGNHWVRVERHAGGFRPVHD